MLEDVTSVCTVFTYSTLVADNCLPACSSYVCQSPAQSSLPWLFCISLSCIAPPDTNSCTGTPYSATSSFCTQLSKRVTSTSARYFTKTLNSSIAPTRLTSVRRAKISALGALLIAANVNSEKDSTGWAFSKTSKRCREDFATPIEILGWTVMHELCLRIGAGYH